MSEIGGTSPSEVTLVPTDEDEEDRWFREGALYFDQLSPEQQAKLMSIGDVLVARMQTPEARAGMQRLFDQGFSSGSMKESKQT